VPPTHCLCFISILFLLLLARLLFVILPIRSVRVSVAALPSTIAARAALGRPASSATRQQRHSTSVSTANSCRAPMHWRSAGRDAQRNNRRKSRRRSKAERSIAFGIRLRSPLLALPLLLSSSFSSLVGPLLPAGLQAEGGVSFSVVCASATLLLEVAVDIQWLHWLTCGMISRRK
jgi:hypothetical protein